MAENSIVNDIYQQFIDYFGEDKVDLQTYNRRNIKINALGVSIYEGRDSIILVHWPVVTVSNEFDESVEIWDLYSATVISPLGQLKGVPYFNRSTYDNIQWQSDYAHKM